MRKIRDNSRTMKYEEKYRIIKKGFMSEISLVFLVFEAKLN